MYREHAAAEDAEAEDAVDDTCCNGAKDRVEEDGELAHSPDIALCTCSSDCCALNIFVALNWFHHYVQKLSQDHSSMAERIDPLRFLA